MVDWKYLKLVVGKKIEVWFLLVINIGVIKNIVEVIWNIFFVNFNLLWV